MASSLEHIESAIKEVSRAYSSLSRVKSAQVRNVDDRDSLKATALAWLQSHRPHVQGVSVDAIDAAFQTILDSTAKLAARGTYLRALKAAKAALVEARRQIAAAPIPSSDNTAEPSPAFSALTADAVMQGILERRWCEVQLCMSVGANLSATVMMGGLLESLLLARINLHANKAQLFTAKSVPKDKAGKPLGVADWKLVAMVGVAHDLGWISKSAKDVGNVLRDYRNYVHPHKEHTDGIIITDEDARMFWDVCKAITRQVLVSVP